MNKHKTTYLCSIINMALNPSYSLTASLLTFMGGGKRARLVLSALAAFIPICILLVSCGKKPVSFTPDERKVADSIVRSTHGIDSLASLQKRLENEGDRLGSIIALREWGKALRNESRFEEALNVHSKGQQQAEAVGDTLEWVQALNNIGTDYRRMGVFDVAQEYHYAQRGMCRHLVHLHEKPSYITQRTG